MKKLITLALTLCMTILLLSANESRMRPSRDSAQSQMPIGINESQTFIHSRQGRSVIFEEGFDETTFPPEGWTRWTSLSGNAANLQWNRSANWWNFVRPIGVASAVSRSWNPDTDEGIDPNNYLITPQIQIPVGLNTELSWFIRAEVDDYAEWGAEQYTVYISTTGNNIADFTVPIHNETFPLPYPQPNPYWMLRHIDLTDYAGLSIYIAFRHHDCFDNSALVLDEVALTARFDDDMSAITVTGPLNLTVGMEGTYDVTIRNAGVNIASGYSVRLLAEGEQVAIVPGVSLNPGDLHTLQINWSPTIDGVHEIVAEIVWAIDQNETNNQSLPLSVIIHPEGMAGVFIGDINSTATHPHNPFNFNYRNNVAQTIYYESEIQVSGTISHVEYTFIGAGDIPTPRAVKLYMATIPTSKTQFDSNSDWIPSSEFTLVYDGYFDANVSGRHDLIITLDTPYLYTEGNLVIMSYRYFDDEPETWWLWSNTFIVAENLGSNRTIYQAIDGVLEDPLVGLPSPAWGRGNIPNTQIYFVTSGLGTISGTVTHDDEPLDDVRVTIAGTYFSTTTDSQGNYTITHIPPDTYDIIASKVGYQTYIESDVVIEADVILELNFNLEPATTVSITGRVIASDTNQPVENASVTISGYADFPAVYTNSLGNFTVPSVYSGQSYYITITATGYVNYQGSLDIGFTNYNAGDIMIFEPAHPPTNVTAAIQDHNVYITWQPPAANNNARSGSSRPLQSYSIYRALFTDINSPELWTFLESGLTTLAYLDTSWSDLDGGAFVFLVVAVYTNGNNSEPAVSNTLSHQAAGVVYVGNPLSSTYNSTIPFNYVYQTGVAQTIYHDEDLPITGAITEITYRINNNNALIPNAVHQVYMAITDRNSFANTNNWIPFSQFTLVFDGYLPPNIPADNNITIELNYPYPYDGGNLVIMTNRQITASNVPFNTWQTTSIGGTHTIYQGRDGENFNLQNLPTGTLTTDRPNIAIKFVNDGIGHLSGVVTTGNPPAPLADVQINLNGTARTVYTNQDGEYSLRFINAGNIGITATKQYYIDLEIDDILIESATTTELDFTMTPQPSVTVTGHAIASDTGLGLDGAIISLEGYQNYYDITSDQQGFFTIPEVYSNYTYTLTIIKSGYLTFVDSVIEIGTTDTYLTDLILTERTIPARNVQVVEIDDEAVVTWEPPGSLPGDKDVFFSHQSGNADTAWGGNWAPNGATAIHRWTPEQLVAAGVAGADLTRIMFHIHPGNDVGGFTSGVTVELRIYTGGTGTPLQPGTLVHFQPVPYYVFGWNNVELTIPIKIPTDKELWFGYFATYETGHPFSVSDLGNGYHGYGYVCHKDGEWGHIYDWEGYNENWMIRGMASGAVGNETRIFSLTNDDRILESYTVYRVPVDDIHQPLPKTEWVQVGTDITDLTFTDETWEALKIGFFRYAVEAVFTNDNIATPAFSNAIDADGPTNIEPPSVVIPEITALYGNYPNPFNPSTVISFDKAEPGFVQIDIFNIRGQKVRSLVNNFYDAGTHKAEWDGSDDAGRNLASGVYFYQMKTEEINDIRRMVLMK